LRSIVEINVTGDQPFAAMVNERLERFPTRRNRLVDKKSLQIQNAGAKSHRKSLSTFSDFALASGADKLIGTFMAPTLRESIVSPMDSGNCGPRKRSAPSQFHAAPFFPAAAAVFVP
jgi:hypothetical protein